MINNMENKKFFLYARKSTDVEDKQVLSIEAQLTELRDYAKRENLNIALEFIEKQSAKIPGRPIFNEMMRCIEKGDADSILSWHPDRLAKNRICIALFNTPHHFVKNWTTWNFSRLFFNKLKGDVQIFSLGIVSQFSKLCLNTQHLLILDISGLASIQKEFFIFHRRRQQFNATNG